MGEGDEELIAIGRNLRKLPSPLKASKKAIMVILSV
jgi:hypothetical protein